MKFPFTTLKPTQAVITQARSTVDGKVGRLEVPGVVTFDTKDSQLVGRNSKGETVMVIPLAEVAAAVIDEVPHGG